MKKQSKERWAAAVSASGTLPRTQHHGDGCTFDFACNNHPWANIHQTHQAWFVDLVAYCRGCGSANTKKGTMQKECRGRPIKNDTKSEPNGLKVIRLMNKGFPPPQACPSGHEPVIDGDLIPGP